jgi:hypothetical protein
MAKSGIRAVVVLAAVSVALPAICHAADFDHSGDTDSGILGRFFGFSSRRVTVRFTKADLTHRSKLQKDFIRILIWRRYGRNTRLSKSLVAKIDAHYRGLVRDKFIAQIRDRYPGIWPFGLYVDRMVTRIGDVLKRSESDGVHTFTVTIPKNWFVKRGAMNLVIEVVKARVPRLDVYQIGPDGRRHRIFTSLAAVGNFYRSFGSPNGILYTSRYIHAPRWYPCATKWATEPCRQPRGLNTAFGLGGIDLTRRDYLVGYGPRWGNGTVSPYLIHSTNMYASPGHYASHGCVRIYPHKADDLFSGLKHYFTKPNATKTRDFGDILPFVKTIPVLMGSPAQLVYYRRQLESRKTN